MPNINHRSRIKEKSKSGSRNTITYSGTREEMEQLQEMNAYGTINEEIGRVSSTRLYQAGSLFWELEVVCELQQGEAATPPDTAFGKKSAELHSRTMQAPLSAHPEYLACWDHYLFAAPGIKGVPNFWDKTQFPLLEEGDAQKYFWGRSPMDAPETNGRRWRALKAPVKQGVQYWDVEVYTLNIAVRFGTFREGCRFVQDVLNKVKSDPGINTGIKPGDWKCDAVDVAWHDEYWLGQLTWSKSGDAQGWDDIYEHA